MDSLVCAIKTWSNCCPNRRSLGNVIPPHPEAVPPHTWASECSGTQVQVDTGRHWGLMAQTNWEQTGPGWISAYTAQGCLNRSEKFMFVLDYRCAAAGPGIQLWVACNEVQAQEFIKALWDQAGIKQRLESALLIYMHLKMCKLYFCVKKYHQSPIRYSCWKGLLVSPHIEQHCAHAHFHCL